MATKKVKKKKLNIKAFLILILTIYLIVMLFHAFLSMPIKNIYIENTKLLTDDEIIETAEIKDYPSIFKLSENKIINNLKKLELVEDVKVTKKLNGKLIIDITERIPLFYNRNTEKVVLSDGLEVDNNSKYLGIPTLINYVTNDLLKEFITAFSKTDQDIIHMINEIEYSPDISDGIVIDNNRFLLRMNDGNHVYINTLNMNRLNNYKTAINKAIGDKKGTLYLDSYDSDNDLIGLFEEFK